MSIVEIEPEMVTNSLVLQLRKASSFSARDGRSDQIALHKRRAKNGRALTEKI